MQSARFARGSDILRKGYNHPKWDTLGGFSRESKASYHRNTETKEISLASVLLGRYFFASWQGIWSPLENAIGGKPAAGSNNPTWRWMYQLKTASCLLETTVKS
jgi:hypothetical protein